MFIIGLLFALLGLAGLVWCIAEAYMEDVTQGVLCMCIPFYTIYYVLVKIEPPKKWIILSLMVVGVVGRVIVALTN